MKPKTKMQHHVLALSNELPKITGYEINWAYKHCLLHVAYRNKSGVACLDCGHRWEGPKKGKRCECPNCFTTLSIKDTRKKKLRQLEYLAIVDTIKGFQVVRAFEVRSSHKVGVKVQHDFWEVVQQWITPDGKGEVVGRMMNAFNNGNFTGDLEIRNPATIRKYTIYPTKIYPSPKVLKIFRRNGFKSSFWGIPPYSLLTSLLDPADKAETLIKSKQYSLLRANAGNGYKILRNWDSIKICIRNNYIVEDASIWFDYLDLLDRYRKDLRNPVIVCPSDLMDAHEGLLRKRRREIARQDRERVRLNAERRAEALKRQTERMEAEQEKYVQSKKPFLGLSFKRGNITVKVLESVSEFLKEADVHGHCVFISEYYKKPESLVLSAQVDGKPVETVEVSLTQLQVVQSRGLMNKPTKFHKEIVSLVTKNMHVIQQRCNQMEVAV